MDAWSDMNTFRKQPGAGYVACFADWDLFSRLYRHVYVYHIRRTRAEWRRVRFGCGEDIEVFSLVLR